MLEARRIRYEETSASDLAQVLALYPRAFPDEDLKPLVKDLLSLDPAILSIAARDGEEIVGHIAFTECRIDETSSKVSLLGPLGILPSYQRQGHGSALINMGLHALRRMGVQQVFVLGDPRYYGRFGFGTERAVQTPCAIPEKWVEAWQSLALGTQAHKGQLVAPEPWMKPALWSG